MSSTTRVAQDDDAAEMHRCALQTIPPAETKPAEHFTRILAAWPGLSHVAVDDANAIIGICLVRLKEDIKDAIHAHVSVLSVLPAYQGQGVGRSLLSVSLHAARTRFDVTHVTLHVRKSNVPAIRLYTSLAFHTTVIKPGFYYDGEDALAMTLAF